MPLPVLAAAPVLAKVPVIGKALGVVNKIPGVKKVTEAVSNLKTSDNVLIRNRDKIFDMFKKAGFKSALDQAVSTHKMTHKDIPNQKVGSSYNPEWKRLYNMVTDTFKHMGREDLANAWQSTVPVFTTTEHPIDFIATLLSGGYNPVSVKASVQNYSVLTPFGASMKKALESKGIYPPSNIEDLTQTFYNNFIAKMGSDYEALNFDEIHPMNDAYVDESVINAVVSYFTDLQARKNSGEVLGKTQDMLATTANRVQDKLQDVALNQVKKEIGGSILDNPWIIAAVFGAVILLAFIALRR